MQKQQKQQCPACESTNVREIVTGSRFYREYHCRACHDWYFIEQPAPAPAPKRQSREQQRNAKAQAAYESIRDLGEVAGRAWQEQFSIASQSQADTRYIVTHDLASDRYICNCPHGQNGKSGCVHELAARRFVTERRERFQTEADAAYQREWRRQSEQAAFDARQRQRDTAIPRRNNQPFSLMR